MPQQINVDLLLRVVADQAKRELAAITTATKAVTRAAQDLAPASTSTGSGLTAMAKGAASAAGAMHALASATAATEVDFAAYIATVGRANGALAGARNAVTGLTTNMVSQTTELRHAREEGELWQQTLDAIRARYNPLFAASRAYEAELRQIAEAEKIGALSAREAAAARDAAAASMAPAMQQQVRGAGMAQTANANLISQWNDIGMMMAAGQSPLMLALQQGTQVAQVFQQMGGNGKDVFAALKQSLLGLLSPMNLLTIGAIGLGAVGVQALMALGEPTKTFDEAMQDLDDTLGRVRGRLDILGDSSLEDRFGNLTDDIRDLTRGFLELDRIAEMRALKDTLKTITATSIDPGFWQRLNSGNETFTAGAVFGTTGPATIQNWEDKLRAENYAALGLGNSYADFTSRRDAIMASAKSGDGDAVSQGLVDLTSAMRGTGAVSAMSDEALKLLLTVAGLAEKTAQVEAYFNGSAKAAKATREAASMSAEFGQQAELSRATLLFGEASAEVDAIRTRQASEALALRLQEVGVIKGSAEEEKALADFDAAQRAERAVADNARRLAIGEITQGLADQLAVSSAILTFGEASAEVEALRAKQADAALVARLEEQRATKDQIADALALAAAERDRAEAIRAAEAARKAGDMLGELQDEAALAEASLRFGKDSLQVKEMQIAAARRAFAVEVEALEIGRAQKEALMAQWEISRGMAGADPFGAVAAGRDMLRDQAERVASLQLEISLAGQNETVRTRILALYRAEQEIREKGIDATSQLAETLRAGALEEADLEARLDRITDAWGRVDSAAASAIDSMLDGLTGGGAEGLKSAAQDMLKMLRELTLNNPLKNAILGSNLPTLSDVGGIGGIVGRLLGGGKAGAELGLTLSSMNAPSMSVQTPMVTLTAGSISGLPGIPASGSGGTVAAAATAGNLLGPAGVQAQIWQFFQGKGLAPHQIAAVMGNVSAESAFDPLAVGDHGQALGLFQWNDRRESMLNFIGGRGNLGNVNAQLEFAWHEMMTSEAGPFARLRASSNLYDATHAMVGFERPQGYSPSNPASASHWNERLGAAEAAMAKFGDTTSAAQAQLGQLGTGAAQLGTGLQGFSASLANTLQGIGAQHGPGGAFVGGLLGEGLEWLGGAFGYERGGWTGPGAPSDVAGVVHAEEYVFDAPAVRRLGADNLEALRRGSLKGFRSGGLVSSNPARPSSIAGGENSADASAGRVVHEINVSGTGDAQIIAGVRHAIESSLELYSRDFLPGEVRGIINDKWRG